MSPSRKGLLRFTAAVPWVALAVVLCVGLPLFVCMPLWADATLYDIAARNVLSGGVHYREVFDTNLPGMVWLHMLVRTLFGWSSEALRITDIVIFTAIVLLLTRWLRDLGLSHSTQVWMAVVLFLFYFALPEWCHCQRDIWMLLPALLALHLRVRLAATRRYSVAERSGERSATEYLRVAANRIASHSSFLEGILWGMAFWIKPFVAIPALAVWGISVLVNRGEVRKLPAITLGGSLVLAVGALWLWRSGSWPYCCDVFLRWNPEYAANSLSLWGRIRMLFWRSFPPWSLLHFAAVPVAVWSVIALVRRADSASDSRGLLACFYLGWVVQAAFVQKCYDYSLASTVPLAVVVLVDAIGRLWSAPDSTSRMRWWRIALVTVPALAFALRAAVHHPLLDAKRLEVWGQCWREGSSAAVRDRLKIRPSGNSPDWADLECVAAYLRERNVGDGELTCYNNSTHPLYLELGVAPATPFLHYDTILLCFPSRRGQLRDILAGSGQRYVVSDLNSTLLAKYELAVPDSMRDTFPWSHRVLFRSGRYVVYDGVGPVEALIPEP